MSTDIPTALVLALNELRLLPYPKNLLIQLEGHLCHFLALLNMCTMLQWDIRADAAIIPIVVDVVAPKVETVLHVGVKVIRDPLVSCWNLISIVVHYALIDQRSMRSD